MVTNASVSNLNPLDIHYIRRTGLIIQRGKIDFHCKKRKKKKRMWSAFVGIGQPEALINKSVPLGSIYWNLLTVDRGQSQQRKLSPIFIWIGNASRSKFIHWNLDWFLTCNNFFNGSEVKKYIIFISFFFFRGFYSAWFHWMKQMLWSNCSYLCISAIRVDVNSNWFTFALLKTIIFLFFVFLLEPQAFLALFTCLHM